jgi:hypothetical protein
VANRLMAIGLTVKSLQYVHIHDCSNGVAVLAVLQGMYAKKS